jgi:hypothetical protein
MEEYKMKNLILILLLFFVATVCSAQVELEANKKGKYRVKEDAQEYATSSITAEPEAIRYIESFSEAIENPNSFISIDKSEKIIKMTGLFKASKEFKEKGVLFNSDENKIVFIEKKEEREEKSFILILAIISVVLIIISNILYNKNKRDSLLATFAVAAVVAAAAAAATATATTTENDYKNYKLAVIIYYILMMALYFAFMFLGI